MVEDLLFVSGREAVVEDLLSVSGREAWRFLKRRILAATSFARCWSSIYLIFRVVIYFHI